MMQNQNYRCILCAFHVDTIFEFPMEVKHAGLENWLFCEFRLSSVNIVRASFPAITSVIPPSLQCNGVCNYSFQAQKQHCRNTTCSIRISVFTNQAGIEDFCEIKSRYWLATFKEIFYTNIHIYEYIYIYNIYGSYLWIVTSNSICWGVIISQV